jgi:ribonuclease HI
MDAKTPNVSRLYADGGVIHSNPSEIGGMWAFRAVTENGVVILEHGGVVPATSQRRITNNQTEVIALVLALEAMPEGWSGKVYSDSQFALGVMFEELRWRTAPPNVLQRAEAAVARAGQITAIHLKGHPTQAELAKGFARCGTPVSVHQVWCDKKCTELGRSYVARMRQISGD